MMQSTNFEFLRPRWPQLAALGGFAESYAHGDPIGALVKLRAYGEQMVAYLYDRHRLPRQPRPAFIDLLDGDPFKQAIPRVIVTKFHALRIDGNRAAHANQGDTAAALRLLKDAHDLGRWLFMTYAAGNAAECAAFVTPPAGGAVESQRRREKKAILERIAAQEAEMQRLLAELEAARASGTHAHATLAELQGELTAARAAAEQSLAFLTAVNPLDFDEAATRRQLIDHMLADAGWPVSPGLASNDRVAKEFRVEHQPTDSGIGYADYVLFDEAGKPLAATASCSFTSTPCKSASRPRPSNIATWCATPSSFLTAKMTTPRRISITPTPSPTTRRIWSPLRWSRSPRPFCVKASNTRK
ncbi:MAG TPA: hypothetical protein VF278_15875 [Pirellulales bacterium]